MQGAFRFAAMKTSPIRPLMRCSHGFTLVELLVVISIIVVLASVAFFASSRMKSSAMKAKELSNIRNISQVVAVYHSDQNKLPGPINRGIRVPSKVADASRANYLSTFLIDLGYFGEDDSVWQTSTTTKSAAPTTTYVLNSTINSAPTYFFGRLQSGGDPPKSLIALQSNIKTSLGGRSPQDPSQLWMVCTADEENYGSSPLISEPSESKSAWGGRFYSFFDGRVKFVRRQSPSIYPSSFSGGYQ